MKPNRLLIAALSLAAFSAPAFAHTGVGATHGVVVGFTHPFSGIDHILVMLAVGVLAAQLSGRAYYLLPLTFMSMMIVGAGLGVGGVALPFVEIGIAVSVLTMGVLVAMGWQLPTAFAMALVGSFAVFHGFAHGAEMPLAASGVAYGAGFVLATGLLHVAGIGLGLAANHLPRAQKAVGVLMTAAGFGLLAGWI